MTTDEPLIAYEGERHVAEVINLADVRVRVGWRKPGAKEPCKHHALVYSASERRVWCEDCNSTVEGFDAFMVLVRQHERMVADARHKQATADAAMKATLTTRAAKEIDRTWRRNMLPVCRFCGNGLKPEEIVGSAVARDYEDARRARLAALAADQPGEPT